MASTPSAAILSYREICARTVARLEPGSRTVLNIAPEYMEMVVAGHFPMHPIVPASFWVEMAMCIGNRLLGRAPDGGWYLDQAVFWREVAPAGEVTVNAEVHTTRLRVSVVVDESIAAAKLRLRVV